MKYRRFGKTNLRLSVFSLGTMRCLTSCENVERVVRHALSLGINHIETARGYGSSESDLGKVLAQLDAGQFYITSKIPPTPDGDLMERSIDESLSRLGVASLDCLAIHGLNTPEHLEWVLSPTGCMAGVQKAVADGRVRHVGFSTHAPLELILAAISTDFFEFVNLHYYLFFQRHAAAIAIAHQQDLGILIISPADKGGRLYTPPPKLQHLCAPQTPLALNYRFLLSDPRITTLSVGPAIPEELNEPLQVADCDEALNPEEIAALERLQAQMSTTLGPEQCQQCYECLPCPESVAIPEILRLRNLAIAYDMDDYGKYRYGMLENAGHWFPGTKGNRCTHCGDCLPRCPAQLDIPTLLLDAHQRLKGQQGRRLWA
ncbi:MAG: aldo/keto reductase [Desertifilum sp. SIO1I2]|nr:aldo/keto reductase [Desertifilum sp. SIO1I2]